MRKRIENGASTGMEPLAVRIPQAAHMLSIGKSKVYEFIATGDIETVKIGRSTLIPMESLKAFLAQRRRT